MLVKANGGEYVGDTLRAIVLAGEGENSSSPTAPAQKASGDGHVNPAAAGCAAEWKNGARCSLGRLPSKGAGLRDSPLRPRISSSPPLAVEVLASAGSGWGVGGGSIRLRGDLAAARLRRGARSPWLLCGGSETSCGRDRGGGLGGLPTGFLVALLIEISSLAGDPTLWPAPLDAANTGRAGGESSNSSSTLTSCVKWATGGRASPRGWSLVTNRSMGPAPRLGPRGCVPFLLLVASGCCCLLLLFTERAPTLCDACACVGRGRARRAARSFGAALCSGEEGESEGEGVDSESPDVSWTDESDEDGDGESLARRIIAFAARASSALILACQRGIGWAETRARGEGAAESPVDDDTSSSATKSTRFPSEDRDRDRDSSSTSSPARCCLARVTCLKAAITSW